MTEPELYNSILSLEPFRVEFSNGKVVFKTPIEGTAHFYTQRMAYLTIKDVGFYPDEETSHKLWKWYWKIHEYHALKESRDYEIKKQQILNSIK